MSSLLPLLLLLACPLMMVFMMRGMHGGHVGKAGGGHPHRSNDDNTSDVDGSLDQLRRQRDQLDRQIDEREAEEQTRTPVRSGWR